MMYSKTFRRGFTLVEALIAFLLAGLFIIAVFYIYTNTMNSYRMTAWKQEKTRQVQLFWERLRKPLEEAANELNVVGAYPNQVINTTRRPLKYKPGSGNGLIMGWFVQKVNIDNLNHMQESPSHEFSLVKEGKLMRLIGPLNPIILEDVESAEVSVSHIKNRAKPGGFEEYIDHEGDANPSVGAIIEISITFSPPPSFPVQTIRLVQNAKFKITIPAEPF